MVGDVYKPPHRWLTEEEQRSRMEFAPARARLRGGPPSQLARLGRGDGLEARGNLPLARLLPPSSSVDGLIPNPKPLIQGGLRRRRPDLRQMSRVVGGLGGQSPPAPHPASAR